MTQHDYNIANQGAAAFRTDLNNALASVLSRNAGTSAPGTTAAALEYHKTNDNWIYRRNSADAAFHKSHKVDDQGMVSQDGHTVYAADAGSNDTYAITLDPAPAAYAAGQTFRFKANTANTGAATLNVNSLGAKTIKKAYNSDLATGDILANQLVEVIYDGTNFQMLSPTAVPVYPLATQTDMEAKTATKLVDANNINWAPGVAKAFVYFTTVTTTTSLADHNMNGLGDNGTGDTTPSIDTDFSSANYVAVVSAKSTAGQRIIVNESAGISRNAGQTAFQTVDPGGTARDTEVNAVWFGDQ